jgi:CheY-like chemotaxis protein
MASRLLLVHQDELFRRTAALSLGLISGGRVEEAGDSVTCQYMMIGQSYDVLILDMDEGEAAHLALNRLRSGSFVSSPRMPVLLLTSTQLGESVRLLLDAGPNEVLFKPVKVRDVARAVQRLQGVPEPGAGH